MSVELFITNLDILTKLQAVFNSDDFILNFNATRINVQGVCLEKVHSRKRQQWKKFTRKKFTVHRKTALKILVKRSQYI